MHGVENKNYYALLGVERNASKEQIRDAYKELARIYHPDSHHYDEILESAGIKQGESETFKYITEAYNTLSNEKARAEYDQAIPADLPSWEDEKKDEWHTDHKVAASPHIHETRYSSSAYGSFGVFKDPNAQARSAFDDERLRSVRPVSEMIRVKRGFWNKLRWLFFLDR